MYITCPNCGQTCEVDEEPVIGQHLVCPFCEVKFCYTGRDSDEATLERDAAMASGIRNACKSRIKKISMPGPKACFDKRHRPKAGEKGCLPIVLSAIAFSIVASYHNWVSVLVAVLLFFFVIVICIYKELNVKLDGRATLDDALKRLGLGGSAISIIATTLGCVFLMQSCDRMAREDKFKNDEWHKQREAQIERDGGWWNSKKCPKCNYRQDVFIQKGEDPYLKPIQCESCGYWIQTRRW